MLIMHLQILIKYWAPVYYVFRYYIKFIVTQYTSSKMYCIRLIHMEWTSRGTYKGLFII